jgi:hypothetical protein
MDNRRPESGTADGRQNRMSGAINSALKMPNVSGWQQKTQDASNPFFGRLNRVC